MWGITHLCNQWEGLTTELVKPRGPSPHVPPTQTPQPPWAATCQRHPHPHSTARPSGLPRTSAPPEENETEGQASSSGWRWGQGVLRPPTGAPCQAQPGPYAQAAHTAAPTESRWEMQSADSEEEGQEDGHHGPQPWASTHPCEPQVFSKSTSTVPVLSHYQTGFEILTKDAAGETKS